VYKKSTVAGADELDVKNMAKTRDPRFEATFWDEPRIQAGTLLYSWKFIDRVGPTYFGKTYPPQYKSITNTNDYPVMRLAEVMLNWLGWAVTLSFKMTSKKQSTKSASVLSMKRQ
jgi:hypothetical protein